MSRRNPEGTLAHGAREPGLGGQPELSTNPDRTAASPQPLLAPPYVIFGRQQWAALRGSASMALSEVELPALAGVNDPASLADVNEVFLPLVRLIDLHIAAARSLGSMVGEAFVGQRRASPPYVVAIAGSVAVGKSTFARILRAVLAQGQDHPRVDLVATDGFLYPTATLEANGLIGRKGFPESYDLRRMLAFLEGVKAGGANLQVPTYSHEAYDIVPGQFQAVDRPDILIFEGLNVLQTANSTSAVASDFFDFTIYLDAETALLETWYADRFLKLQRTVFQRETSFFHHYKDLTPEAARDVARAIWRRINLPNLTDNIEPTRRRARVVLRKGASHRVEEVWLRQN
jgi:type I pantothenate kinase